MMKRTLLLLFFTGIVAFCLAQPKLSNGFFPKTAPVFGLYEISFNLGSYTNPYDPKVIDVNAEFRSPSGETYRVNGFYYEGYNLLEKNGVEVASRNGDNDSWRIRFTPNTAGRWTYVINLVDRTGSIQLDSYAGNTLAFECQAGNAEGFIRKANANYLKRETFINGRRQYHSYYPIGPNVAWYSSSDYGKFRKPYGIFDYKKYIDQLSGNANHMRIWLSRYQYMSLYGPEHAIRDNGKPVMYFDSELNQKDAAELDFIVSYSAEHGINLMLCFFTFGDFRDDSEALNESEKNASMPSGWQYNPYHTQLKLQRPAEFFSNPEAMRITGNLIRYIVARWGYATNVECWELWNEVCNVFKNTDLKGDEEKAILQWHQKMSELIHSCDPHQHLITTSLGSVKGMESLSNNVYNDLDIVQVHYYDNIQKAKSSSQMTYKLFYQAEKMREQYPKKPNYIGEFGLNSKISGIDANNKDPNGVDLHNSLWASVFSGAMGPASYWYWRVLDKHNLFGRFKPMMVFCGNLPVLSDAFTPAITGYVEGSSLAFPGNLQTYYLINAEEDTLVGWCQDAAFSYQALRSLTDREGNNGHFDDEGVFDPEGYVYTLNQSVKPQASTGNNTIRFQMSRQSRGTRYQVRWYDTETGEEIPSEATTATVRRRWFRNVLNIQFPSSIRDTRTGKIGNTFGDAVFMVTKISD